jgi:hypothetical protein
MRWGDPKPKKLVWEEPEGEKSDDIRRLTSHQGCEMDAKITLAHKFPYGDSSPVRHGQSETSVYHNVLVVYSNNQVRCLQSKTETRSTARGASMLNCISNRYKVF